MIPVNVEAPLTFTSSKSAKPSTVSFWSTSKFFLKVEFSNAVKISTLTPPLKVDTPRTSNNSFGCVLPIPTLLLT